MPERREARAGRPFFQLDTPDLAKRLIGCELVHESPDGTTAGRIVEVEAYLSENDEASHSRNGVTRRNASMFLGPGHAYVYSIYGMHLCFNVVSADAGVGEAILIRALEPTRGRDVMLARRGRSSEREWCSGPARLVQALGIQREHDGMDLVNGDIYIIQGQGTHSITSDRRIGISRARGLCLRFLEQESAWLSRPSQSFR